VVEGVDYRQRLEEVPAGERPGEQRAWNHQYERRRVESGGRFDAEDVDHADDERDGHPPTNAAVRVRYRPSVDNDPAANRYSPYPRTSVV
jgi:hypothetical protein